MKRIFKYLNFIKARKQNPRTWIYLVRAKQDHILLGIIKWYPSWRQYAFYPEQGTVFEKTCLEDIRHFCIELNERQKLRSQFSK